jgi:predicted pyridoxine 5'-phosphate oxidase superfamily flavin-nucleotide-binding protein
MSMFHEGQRELQDRFMGRAIADRLEHHRMHTTFTEADRELIETSRFFFLATAWNESVDCSHKGGIPGFVRVTAPSEISWPDYDGNRMYRSLGNIIRSPSVGLLFLKFDGVSTRLRISGKARLDESPEAIAGLPGAKRLIRVTAQYIFSNCPRYIPRMQFVDESAYSPRSGHTAPIPEWKTRDYIREVLKDDKP